MSFQCAYCPRSYSNSYALKRHISEKHPITDDLEEELPLHSDQTIYQEISEDATLWDIDTISVYTSDSQTNTDEEDELVN